MAKRKDYGHVLRVWDRGDKGYDRYTILPPATAKAGYFKSRIGLWHGVGASENPSHPMGFGQSIGANPGSHLGKRIHWSEVPEGVKKFALYRFPEFANPDLILGKWHELTHVPEMRIFVDDSCWKDYGHATVVTADIWPGWENQWLIEVCTVNEFDGETEAEIFEYQGMDPSFDYAEPTKIWAAADAGFYEPLDEMKPFRVSIGKKTEAQVNLPHNAKLKNFLIKKVLKLL